VPETAQAELRSGRVYKPLALGFMLVFRLSRAAIRFWDCRTAWGDIILHGRYLVDDAIVSMGAGAPQPECLLIVYQWRTLRSSLA